MNYEKNIVSILNRLFVLDRNELLDLPSYLFLTGDIQKKVILQLKIK